MPPREFRKRYVAFVIEAPRNIERWEMISALQKMATAMNMLSEGERRPWLTTFRDNRGILRCVHTDKERAIELLTNITELGEEQMKVEITTIKTSGTIKKAKASIPEPIESSEEEPEEDASNGVEPLEETSNGVKPLEEDTHPDELADDDAPPDDEPDEPEYSGQPDT